MNVKFWIKSGEPWVWLNAAAVAACILLVAGLLSLIVSRGMVHFWPLAVHEIVYLDQNGLRTTSSGQIRARETVKIQRLIESGLELESNANSIERILLKTGNRDLSGEDFRWILQPQIIRNIEPLSLVVLEREQWGTFFGRVLGLKQDGQIIESKDVWSEFQLMIERVAGIRKQLRQLEKVNIRSLNHRLEQIRLQERQLKTKGVGQYESLERIQAEKALLQQKYQGLEQQLSALNMSLQRDTAIFLVDGGQRVELSLATIYDAWKPNSMDGIERVRHYGRKFWSFLTDDPREANTEGGVYPAIFGTVLMVLLMTVVVTPLGVIAGIYLKEYARQGFLTRTIRVAVNNLAGVPSVVYGVFGLGFFVYTIGGSIDKLFYKEALPAPTFGTGGLLWASLTLALLTLPVVIVSTEEGLARIPRSIREGSLALGATQWETLRRTVIPMASPGIISGMILAVARAAGEVAPLMLVGVVKLAPSLPLDGNAPFLHLEQKFMHLGFHIYDVGFQSPNIEAARPLVYATAFLLVVVILLLNMIAIHARNRLRDKYSGLES